MLSVISAGLALLMSSVAARGMSIQDSKLLKLRGSIESVQLKEIDRSSALIDIKLKMELVNVGLRPIILLQREPLFPGGALARKPEDFEVGNLLVVDAGWPSDELAPEWTVLRSNLDKPI